MNDSCQGLTRNFLSRFSTAKTFLRNKILKITQFCTFFCQNFHSFLFCMYVRLITVLYSIFFMFHSKFVCVFIENEEECQYLTKEKVNQCKKRRNFCLLIIIIIKLRLKFYNKYKYFNDKLFFCKIFFLVPRT